MRLKFLFSFFAVVYGHYCFAQNKTEYKTWDPSGQSQHFIEGQGWTKGLLSPYDRLPAKAENHVRKAVWDLSRNSAGLQLHFRTNATEVVVKYAVSGNLQMPHMPATGVSGVDLYAKDPDGKWLWCAGKYVFGDTITYHFKNLLPSNEKGREYTLYLPLYNSVKWMNVSVPQESLFVPSLTRQEKPIVVYGTSIAQGGCASRPGLAWTNILNRKLDLPLINLAFSGNGKLEKEVLEYIVKIDAKLYVLDCLPNLVGGNLTISELKKRITDAVNQLQHKRPGVPILLTAHDGYTDEAINLVRRDQYQGVNMALQTVFDSLSKQGSKEIYLLSKVEINQDIESTVDGVHPNDIGMMNYALAYEKKIREIFKEPIGKVSTTIPRTQYRDAPTYFWDIRHQDILTYNRLNNPKLVFLGNSITHYWGGKPTAPRINGEGSWKKYFEPRSAGNLGMGWDRIENVLWRVYHGELDGIAPKQIVVMIGTNNLQLNSDEEIIDGIRLLLAAIHTKQPSAKIILLGLLPRRQQEERVKALNLRYEEVAMEMKIFFADGGGLFLDENHKIKESLFSDGLHPNAAGYELLGGFINTRL